MAFGIGKGAKDPRGMIGQNPTGRPRRSSASKRRQEEKKANARKDTDR